MSTWRAPLPYFSSRELECPCCGVIAMDLRFAALLPALRQQWGKPLVPSSVCRCPDHNRKEHGHLNSLHLTINEKWMTPGSMAADIKWRMWEVSEKLQFARLAHRMGFRIGLHDGFCHLDLGRALGISPKPFVYGVWSVPFSAEEVIT